MRTDSVVAGAAMVLLLWLLAIFYDRISSWRTPWPAPPRHQVRMMKWPFIGLAVFATIGFALVILVATTGRRVSN